MTMDMEGRLSSVGLLRSLRYRDLRRGECEKAYETVKRQDYAASGNVAEVTTCAAEGILHETSLQCSQCPEINWRGKMNLSKLDAIPPVDALLGHTSQRLLIETLLLTAIPADPLRPSSACTRTGS